MWVALWPGQEISSGRLYQGKRATRVVDNLTVAGSTEAAMKGDMVRGEDEIDRSVKLTPTLGELWAKYLPWAKEHKKTWDDDMFNYQKHLEPPLWKETPGSHSFH